MVHRSVLNSFIARLRVCRQPDPPSSSGVSGPPERRLCAGTISVSPPGLAAGLAWTLTSRSLAWRRMVSPLFLFLLAVIPGPDAGELLGALSGGTVHRGLDQGEDRALERRGGQHLWPPAP